MRLQATRSASASRPPSKRRLALSFLLLVSFGLSMFFVLIVLVRTKGGSSPTVSTRKGGDVNEDRMGSAPVETKPSAGKKLVVRLPTRAYSFALVIMTSTNGRDRREERDQIWRALCSGENARLLSEHKFSIYLSVDALVDPGKLEVPAMCTSNFDVVQWHAQSSTAAGFAGSPTGRISSHFREALKKAFAKHSHAIFLEDDLLPSHDFVSLFVPSSPAFQSFEAEPDKVWCISSWNDYGVKSHATNHERLFRTDFFPGLGWMTSKDIFEGSVRRKWSLAATTGWDNWLRSNNDAERSCIVPEVNRVRHISTSGVNVNDPTMSLFGVYSFATSPQGPGRQNLTDWSLIGGDSSTEYDRLEEARMLKARRVDYFKTKLVDLPESGDVLIVYERSQHEGLCSTLGVLPPIREPRAYHKGVIWLRRQNEPDSFIFLCDVIRCASDRLFRNEFFFKPSKLILGAAPGKSCDEICTASKLRCNNLTLQTIAYPPGKACTVMRTYFNCAGGCSHQVGTEMPAMVVGNMDTKGQCLTGISAVPDCGASHPATRRLCACTE